MLHQGTEPDPVEAAEQYQIASDVDHNPQAMFNLGYMHELGIGRAQVIIWIPCSTTCILYHGRCLLQFN